MRSILQKLGFTFLVLTACLIFQEVKAQATCGAGFTKGAINHDLHYFQVIPASPLNYTFGKNDMRLAWTGASNFFRGNTGSHTGETGSFATGQDLKFDVPAVGADTLVFNQEVTNLKFSVADIDFQHRIVFTARNAAGTALPVTIALAAASSATLTISGSGSTTLATASANSTQVANNVNTATANITIAGPVKTVIMTITKNSGSVTDSIFISDISACNNNSTLGVFPANYQAINTPDPGMPSFVLAAYKDSIIMVDITNRASSLLYEDLSLAATGINSLAVDPVNKVIYYTDNVRSATNKSVYKFDIQTRTKTTWIADVTTLGIVLYSSGLGSGGASFYDGALYLGQDVGSTAGEPVGIYRIDINGSGNPVKATRFWSQQGNNVTSTFFDWSDFVINDGVLYNFNFARQAATGTRVMHISLDSMVTLAGTTDTFPKAQVSVDYAGNIYNMSSAGTELYDPATRTFGALVPYTGTGTSLIIDAAESYKPTFDYGDAPVGYGKAVHLFNVGSDLIMGATVDYQPRDTTNASANADDLYNTGSADDEDGVSSFPTLTIADASYSVTVTVKNTTGANATLYGFIDFNIDGDFADAGERSSGTTVANGATSVTVTWTGLTGGVVGSSFARFRLASSATEAQNRSGYSASGEAEDYPIPINSYSLPVELISFKGELKENKSTLLTWSTASELNNDYFQVQRKSQQTNTWVEIGKVQGFGNSHQLISYNFTDENPQAGENYYRLNQVDFNGKSDYSPTIMIKFDTPADEKKEAFVLYPNPVRNEIWIKSENNITAENRPALDVFNISGDRIYSSVMQESLQHIDLTLYQKGMYFIKIGSKTYWITKE